MTDFVLAWVLVTVDGYSVISYSPPMATQEECQNLAAWVKEKSITNRLCMPIHVLRGAKQ